jgi:hypothetical protein
MAARVNVTSIGQDRRNTVDASNTHKSTSQLSCPLCASKATDPDLSEILTSTPWSAILVPSGLAILVILAVLALVILNLIKPVKPLPNSLENNSRIEGQ